jgi:hypothetical protein
MINLPPIGIITQTTGATKTVNYRRVSASAGTVKREGQFMERRRLPERRDRGLDARLMDRRLGLDRRRSRIHFKV